MQKFKFLWDFKIRRDRAGKRGGGRELCTLVPRGEEPHLERWLLTVGSLPPITRLKNAGGTAAGERKTRL